jgi:Tfp pilus tip-associated adhesin PilY1
MNMVINFHVPGNKGNLLASWGTITFPRRNLFRGVMCFLRHREHRSHYRDQSVNSVDRNNRCLLWQSYETHQYTLLALRTVNSVKADSTFGKYCMKGLTTSHHTFSIRTFTTLQLRSLKLKWGLQPEFWEPVI